MQVKTILNRIQKQRGFVYRDVRFEHLNGVLVLTVDLYPHARNQPACADCGQRRPQYDRLPPRRFEPRWTAENRQFLDRQNRQFLSSRDW